MLNNLRIRTCLIGGIGFLAALLTVLGALGLYSLQSTNDALQSMYANRLVAMNQLSQVMVALDLSKSGIASAILDPANVDTELDKLELALKKGETAWKVYAATQLTVQERQLAQGFFSDYGKLLKDGVRPAMEAMRSFNVPGATELYSQNLIPLHQAAQVPMAQLIQLQQQVGQQIYQQSQQRYRLIFNASVTAMGLGLLFAVAMGIFLLRAISLPLAHAVKIAQNVAAGDLTQHIDIRSTNETGQLLRALKSMNDDLLHIVGKVRSSTETIAAASTEIASGNQDLSARTEQQAAALEETASSMEQLTATVQQNADHAHQANALVIAAAEVAAQGGEAVGQVVATMGDINQSSHRIVDIISVIDGIAFQTNILALNAAVEAARAGEQGRGFAVVASEVRGLAQRSASAAKEIKTLIDDSVGKVSNGSKLVERAGLTMRQVVESVNRVTGIVGAIADASHQQRHGIEQVNHAITQIDETTQHNAALVEQATAAAQALREQASELSTVVGVFRLEETLLAPLRNVAQALPTPTEELAGEFATKRIQRIGIGLHGQR